MDKPKAEIYYRHYYPDRVVVGGHINHPGLLIVFPNSDYLFERGKYECNIISKEEGTDEMTPERLKDKPLELAQAYFECTDRKCKLCPDGCDLFTENITKEIKLRATSRIILGKAVEKSGLTKKEVFGSWISPTEGYWEQQVECLQENKLATYNNENETLTATDMGAKALESAEKFDEFIETKKK
jgi:hypothetical protein